MAANSTRKKVLKIFGIIIGVLLVLLTGFHFWFKAHAKQMLEDLVETKSKGKLKMKVGKFKFGYFNKKMELDKVVFYNTDTVNENTAYHFSTRKINMQGKGILEILFDKEFLIDSLTLFNPEIAVTRLKVSTKENNKFKEDVSIPEEMGKVYNSIRDALSVLKVTKFKIIDGQFTLINKIQNDQLPLHISNINFQIDNFLVKAGNSKHKEKILFSDNVTFQSNNQVIVLPDGRHSISFRDFKIDLKNKLVQFDSCTLAASRTDSNNSSFNVFFDKLSLTNIDFDTLYKAEVIKADSVYCINPRFDLKVEIVKKKEGNKAPPKLEDIIKQLTGDLLLAHVVVTNADINIETTKDGVPSSFTFTKNNFEMQGLTIDQSAQKPLTVERFSMSIRNYENFIKDSSYSIKFDSVLFKDDRISLNNFLLEKLDNGKRVSSFRIPQFFLGGLSWDALVFDKILRADQATMFYPDIIYTANFNKKNPGKQNIFQALGAVNEFMDLNYLEVVDGNIDLTLKKDLRLKLHSANLSIESNSLLSSKKIATIKNSLNTINFEKGKLLAGTLEIDINNLQYIGNNGHFVAKKISLQDMNKNYTILIEDVDVDRMMVDETTGNIDAENINWKKGKVNIVLHKTQNPTTQSILILKNLKGENTNINIYKDDLKITSSIRDVNLKKLESQPGNAIILEGLNTNGSQLKIKNNKAELSIGDYRINDNNISIFNQLSFHSNTSKSIIDFSSPSISFIPSIKSLLDKEIVLDDLVINKPVLKLHLNALVEVEKSVLPNIKINSFKTNQPQIDFAINDSSYTSFKWNGTLNSSAFLAIKEIAINTLKPGYSSIKEIKLNMSDFHLGINNKNFSSEKGNIITTIKNVVTNAADQNVFRWDGLISELKATNFYSDSLGKRKGNLVINNAELNSLTVSSATILNIRELIASNNEFQIKRFTGNYKDSQNVINWTDAAFNQSNNNFSLNSFSYFPALSRDSFLAQQNFQKDFITFKTGPINISQLNSDLFFSKNILKAKTIKISDATITDYKDKQIPFNPGLLKPLPVNLLKKIPLHLFVENVEVDNGNILYTETSPKTNATGEIPVTRMKLKLNNIKNFDFLPGDSLMIDATAFLLDTAYAHLNIKESYNDPNNGFLLKFQLSPTDLTIINDVLMPLASVKLESGMLDTLYVIANGNEEFATGDIVLLYKNLKINLFKDVRHQKFKSFLANTFVIKKNNKTRTSQVFFIRNRDRSAINYYIKIIGSGVASSVGAKNNKKLLKKYQKSKK